MRLCDTYQAAPLCINYARAAPAGRHWGRVRNARWGGPGDAHDGTERRQGATSGGAWGTWWGTGCHHKSTAPPVAALGDAMHGRGPTRASSVSAARVALV